MPTSTMEFDRRKPFPRMGGVTRGYVDWAMQGYPERRVNLIHSVATERVLDREEDGITQERFNEKMDALDRENPEPLRRLLARQNLPADMVITIDPEGGVTALKRDEFSLGFLGKEEVGRASTIDWNADTQSWGIKLCAPYDVDFRLKLDEGRYSDHHTRSTVYPECVGFHSYEDARDCEVRWLEHCHEKSIQPLSRDGLAFLATLRARKHVG